MSPLNVLVVTLALAGSACTATVETAPPPPAKGSVVFDWSVGGTTDPEECRVTGASTFSVTIFDAGDREVGTFDAACASFITEITLVEGHYSADAVLVDAAGHVRTTTINVVPFDVIRGTSLDIPVDFPSGSFY